MENNPLIQCISNNNFTVFNLESIGLKLVNIK